MSHHHEDNKVHLLVEGMTCTNCALGVKKQLEKKGMANISVDFASGEVEFENVTAAPLEEVKKGIESLGYKVVKEEQPQKYSLVEKLFFITLPFTFVLLLHMFIPYHLFHNKWLQLALSTPVFFIGMIHFGKSAFNSLKSGVPNMDVLIFIGSFSAYVYSFYGTIILNDPNYLFFETSASIITLVLFGNVLEHRSVKKTTSAISELTKIQEGIAKKLVDGKVVEIPFSAIQKGDVLIVNTGDKIPSDCKIIEGKGVLNESILTGESTPVTKRIGDMVIGGSILEDGNLKLVAERTGNQTVLSQIIELVKKSRQEQPQIQRLGDKISAIFVPAVIAIALLTFFLAAFAFNVGIRQALMNAVAVLVISCPCAMGLATPTAVMVGIGRAAKNGILFKGGGTIEKMANIKHIIFDKTGTLTTGDFKINNVEIFDSSYSKKQIFDLIYSIEKHSSHPIAKSLTKLLNEQASTIAFTSVKEDKGSGITAIDKENNTIKLGSKNYLETDKEYPLLLSINNKIIAGIEIVDELKEDAKEVVEYFNSQGIDTVLLSGDIEKKCNRIAEQLNIKTVYSNQKPEQKLQVIDALQKTGFVAMVGDGVNDAPALNKAAVGISITNATQVAIESANVVVLNEKSLQQIALAHKLGKQTLKTIKQNLFWAFFYNVVAIPVAAFGLLTPIIAALAMAFSDVIVIGNSLRLRKKRLD